MKKRAAQKKAVTRTSSKKAIKQYSPISLLGNIRKHKFKTIILLVLVLLLANWGYSRLQAYKDKIKFEEAELAILDLGEKVKQEIGGYDEVKQNNSCSYASRKFSRGPRRCVVSLNFLYVNKSVDKANHILKEVSKIIGTKVRPHFLSDVSVFVSKDLESGAQRLNQDIRIQSEKRCSVEYTYGIEESYLELFHPLSDQDLEITFYCSGPAKDEYYPLRS